MRLQRDDLGRGVVPGFEEGAEAVRLGRPEEAGEASTILSIEALAYARDGARMGGGQRRVELDLAALAQAAGQGADDAIGEEGFGRGGDDDARAREAHGAHALAQADVEPAREQVGDGVVALGEEVVLRRDLALAAEPGEGRDLGGDRGHEEMTSAMRLASRAPDRCPSKEYNRRVCYRTSDPQDGSKKPQIVYCRLENG